MPAGNITINSLLAGILSSELPWDFSDDAETTSLRRTVGFGDGTWFTQTLQEGLGLMSQLLGDLF